MTTRMDVLLTGASGVIGKAVAKTLAQAGFNLHLTSRQPKKLLSLKQDLMLSGAEVWTYPLNLANPAQGESVVKAFLKKARTPFGLICNAGHMGELGPFVETSFLAWTKGFRENFLSHAAMIRAFAGGLKARRLKRGAVVVLSGGGVGGNSSFSNMTSYSTAKAALVHLVEALSEELTELGITINAIAPGPVLSGMTRQALKAGARAGIQATRARECQESGGVPPERAAQAVEFLLSPEARAVSGRLLSARFDMQTLQADPSQVQQDANLYRLRRIDNELFASKSR